VLSTSVWKASWVEISVANAMQAELAAEAQLAWVKWWCRQQMQASTQVEQVMLMLVTVIRLLS
jgi:hypothetical protein